MCSCFPSANKCRSSSPNIDDTDSLLIARDGLAVRLRGTRRGASAGFFTRFVLLESFLVMQTRAPMFRESDQTKDWKVPPGGDRYRRRFPVRADCFLLLQEFPGSAGAAKAARVGPSTRSRGRRTSKSELARCRQYR